MSRFASFRRAFALAPLALSLTLAGFTALSQADDKIPGIDTAGFDATARPQDGLFEAYSGQWLKSTEIPADKSTWGSFSVLAELSDKRLKSIVDELTAK